MTKPVKRDWYSRRFYLKNEMPIVTKFLGQAKNVTLVGYFSDVLKNNAIKTFPPSSLPYFNIYCLHLRQVSHRMN